MSHIILLGMNHKTAPVEIREQLAVACRKEVNPLHMLPHLDHVDELVFLSTCNRVEFLFTCGALAEGIGEVKALLRTHVGLPTSVPLDSYLYVHKDLEAVKHLFMVASSLDSMVVGEPQILGQLKDAYRLAVEYRTVKTVLNRLVHKSFSVAKRVRTETCIGSCAVSVSYAAVELARKIFGHIQDKKVLLIGAGEMAELAAEHFLRQGVRSMMVANRTLERAVELAARFKAETVPFDLLLEELKATDIVVSLCAFFFKNIMGSCSIFLIIEEVRISIASFSLSVKSGSWENVFLSSFCLILSAFSRTDIMVGTTLRLSIQFLNLMVSSLMMCSAARASLKRSSLLNSITPCRSSMS